MNGRKIPSSTGTVEVVDLSADTGKALKGKPNRPTLFPTGVGTSHGPRGRSIGLGPLVGSRQGGFFFPTTIYSIP